MSGLRVVGVVPTVKVADIAEIGIALAKAKPKTKKRKLRRRRVFVVHGRNREAREAMDRFLYSIGLLPLYFDEARKLTGKATPFVLDVVKKGLSATQATLVLMTPDDVGCLRQAFRGANEPSHEVQLTARPRQNGVFEAGMAMALRPDQTVLVELGDPHTISDLAGFHFIRMDNSIEKRKMLADSLETAKCRVDRSGSEWKDKQKGGDFDAAIQASKYNIDEETQSLREELQRIQGRGPEPLIEQPRPFREQVEPAPVSEKEQRDRATAVAFDVLKASVTSSGLGEFVALGDIEIYGTGSNRLVEGVAYLGRAGDRKLTRLTKWDSRVLVKGSQGEVLLFRRKGKG
jgi:predicted nucleotide-binding protein